MSISSLEHRLNLQTVMKRKPQNGLRLLMTPFLTVKLFSCLKSVWFDLIDKKTVNDKLFMFLGEVVCNVIAIIKLSPNLRKPGI